MRSRTLALAVLGLALVVATGSFSVQRHVVSSNAQVNISGLKANASAVPLYEKFELTFGVDNSPATNLQLPYDPSPPSGLVGRVGISVEALFLPPGETDWRAALRQPAFLYQDYERQQIDGAEWLYPQGQPVWKIRFAPKVQGTWRYIVRVQDASICPEELVPCPNWVESETGSFIALPPREASRGFVEVSKTDPRYFAFSNGEPFVGIGHNTSFDNANFTYDAEEQLARYAANGVEFVRAWMSGSTIAGSSWSPWAWFGGPRYGGYLPDPGIWIAPTDSEYDYVFDLTHGLVATSRPCVFNGWTQGHIPVKPNTTYRISVRVHVDGIIGPRDASNPNYGFTVKLGGWPDECPDGLSSYPNLVPYLREGGWTTLEGALKTDTSQWFLDNVYVMLDNVSSGQAHVGEVSLREVLSPDGSLGPELSTKSKGDAHMDFNQQRSWDWDYVLDRAAQNGVYLKLVVLEKNDRVWNFINRDGTMSIPGDNDNFYAATNTKVRRLHEYYWRYLAARWGYSTAIHSWELLNEGDPFNCNHYDQANEFARFMHEWDRNHLATTSFWHSYPAEEFWNNPSYSNPDYADIHAYTDTGTVDVDAHDAAGVHLAYSQYVRSFNIPKPTVRGETGISSSRGEEAPDLAKDERGVWLHNFTWAQLDSGGVYELYWWTDNLVKKNLYFQYRPFRDFLADFPLDNGRYEDAQAEASADDVRVVGQIDRMAGRAHLWIQNKNHTWWNVVKGTAWGRLSGDVAVPGFVPNQTYFIQWWEFDDPGNLTRRTGTITADAAGSITLDLSTLSSDVTDVAVKIGSYR